MAEQTSKIFVEGAEGESPQQEQKQNDISFLKRGMAQRAMGQMDTKRGNIDKIKNYKQKIENLAKKDGVIPELTISDYCGASPADINNLKDIISVEYLKRNISPKDGEVCLSVYEVAYKMGAVTDPQLETMTVLKKDGEKVENSRELTRAENAMHNTRKRIHNAMLALYHSELKFTDVGYVIDEKTGKYKRIKNKLYPNFRILSREPEMRGGYIYTRLTQDFMEYSNIVPLGVISEKLFRLPARENDARMLGDYMLNDYFMNYDKDTNHKSGTLRVKSLVNAIGLDVTANGTEQRPERIKERLERILNILVEYKIIDKWEFAIHGAERGALRKKSSAKADLYNTKVMYEVWELDTLLKGIKERNDEKKEARKKQARAGKTE